MKENVQIITTIWKDFFVFLTVLYIFLLEWSAITEASVLIPIVQPLKLIIPCALFLMVAQDSCFTVHNSYFNRYKFLFILFLTYALLPTISSEFAEEGLYQWIKFLPRFIFFIAVTEFFLHNNEKMIAVAYSLIYIVPFVVVQYSILVMTYPLSLFSNTIYQGTRGFLYGPLGLLGNSTAIIYDLPGLPFALPRLASFWCEPSKASGYLFAMFFLAQGLYHFFGNKRVMIISYISLVAGCLCFSSAGYFSLAGTVLFGSLVGNFGRDYKWKIKKVVTVGLASMFVATALLGRLYLVENQIDDPLLHAIFGVRNIQINNSIARANYDFTDGRTELLEMGFDLINERPFGIGFRIPGETETGEGFISSASAPVMWLTFTGIPGLAILLLMQFIVLSVIMKKRDSLFRIRLAQAWMALNLQNLLYGSWFDPLYFVSIAMIFCAYCSKESTFTSLRVKLLSSYPLSRPIKA